MWPKVVDIDLTKRAPKLDVPVFFFMGRNDWNTPWPLAEEYLDMLVAPKKELVWFEESGHCPYLEEPDRFGEELVRAFLGSDSSAGSSASP
jgi:pimeloyl-ACP methyl ester carboxylesterase